MAEPTLVRLPTAEDAPSLPLVPTAAQAVGVGTSTAYELARSGEFPVPVFRVGSQWRVRTAELRQFLGLDK
jgi:excisionase family DNA binding protein